MQLEALGDKFFFTGVIGQGECSTVYQCRDSMSGATFACKKIDLARMPPTLQQAFKEELCVAFGCSHPHMVQYHHISHDDAKATYYLLMDYYQPSTLEHILQGRRESGRPIPEAVVWRILIQALQVLSYLHGQKTTNTSGHITPYRLKMLRLSDFYLDLKGNLHLNTFRMSRHSGRGFPPRCCMPPEYTLSQSMAPTSDVWALGAVIYELCTQRTMHWGSTPCTQDRMCNRGSPLPLTGYSKSLQDIISSMLATDPNQRMMPQQLLSMNPLRQYAIELGEQPKLPMPQSQLPVQTQFTQHQLQTQPRVIVPQPQMQSSQMQGQTLPAQTLRVQSSQPIYNQQNPPTLQSQGPMTPSTEAMYATSNANSSPSVLISRSPAARPISAMSSFTHKSQDTKALTGSMRIGMDARPYSWQTRDTQQTLTGASSDNTDLRYRTIGNNRLGPKQAQDFQNMSQSPMRMSQRLTSSTNASPSCPPMKGLSVSHHNLKL
ncbi:Kinase, NEK [Giardia muris]|uniref:non-specific serine/threonine protein kinase n=1 Tax=Giardia muris TaxID=5742 RepID=A0A4Z1SX39_GIAMU|nr:Kinase, NEK [Giardia muris]|eukprot:TNJ30362.1 Kinase, NEK [Giardia muris]